MKRSASKKNGTFRTIHPLTRWCFCLRCKQEVSKEPLWEVNSNENNHTFYFCKDCVPTKEAIVATCRSIFRLFIKEV